MGEREKTLWFEKDQERIYNALEKSRDDWLERLQQQSEAHHKTVRPLQETTANTQIQRDSLKSMRDQREKETHPDLYAAHLAHGDTTPMRRVHGDTTPMVKMDAKKALPAIKHDVKLGDADGEDEAFADAPARGLGLVDDKEDKP